MQDLNMRSLRAAVRESADGDLHDGTRRRRGSLMAGTAAWRRTELGTNQIASFGVWRRGTRRQATRLNRAGLTRWHMPHQGGVKIALPGAVRETANEN
jgi:hypothetical protein